MRLIRLPRPAPPALLLCAAACLGPTLARPAAAAGADPARAASPPDLGLSVRPAHPPAGVGVRTVSALAPEGLLRPPVPAQDRPAAGGAPTIPPGASVAAEAARLRARLAAEVPHLLPHDDTADRRLLALVQPVASRDPTVLDHPQLVVAVDRNPRVQALWIVLARPNGPWEVLGGTHVSTGQYGRFDHYPTPVGVFAHTDLILDYRAEGTFNENHIRGLGVKGMRVWDFGWQWTRRGWGTDDSPFQIRMEMHATDPSVLAQRIGHTASQGCIRIPEAMNRFLDRHGVLDADYERAAADDISYRALLLPDRTPTPLAGSTLVVVDSSGAA